MTTTTKSKVRLFFGAPVSFEASLPLSDKNICFKIGFSFIFKGGERREGGSEREGEKGQKAVSRKNKLASELDKREKRNKEGREGGEIKNKIENKNKREGENE